MQVTRRREDRVDRVVGVGVACVDGVYPVLQPGFGHELHPSDRTRGRHRHVGAEVRLDFVDGCEDRPRHTVLNGRGLVDREQEQWDPVEVECAGRGGRAGDHGRKRARLGRRELWRRGDVAGALERGDGRGRGRGRRGGIGRSRVSRLLSALNNDVWTVCRRLRGFGGARRGGCLRWGGGGSAGRGRRRARARARRGGGGVRRGGLRRHFRRGRRRGTRRRRKTRRRVRRQRAAGQRPAQPRSGQPTTRKRGEDHTTRPNARAIHA